jgi:hypothetical protein
MSSRSGLFEAIQITSDGTRWAQFDLPPTLRFRADGWTSTGEYVAGFYSNVQLGAACHAIPNTSIAGLAAVLTTERPGACGALQTDEAITARITLHDGGDLLMRACLQLPDLAASEQLVSTMLASVSIGND